MSMVQAVLVADARFPTVKAWSDAITALGLSSLVLGKIRGLRRHSGNWPCRYEGKATGFDFGLERLDEAELDEDIRDEILERAEGRELLVSFATGASEDAYFAALTAAAVLAAITDGVYWHAESNGFFSSDEALAMARKANGGNLGDRIAAAVVRANRLLGSHSFATAVGPGRDDDADDLSFDVVNGDAGPSDDRFGGLRFLAPCVVPDALGPAWYGVTMSAVRLPNAALPAFDRYAASTKAPLFAFRIDFPADTYTSESPLVAVPRSPPVFILAAGLEVEIDEEASTSVITD